MSAAAPSKAVNTDSVGNTFCASDWIGYELRASEGPVSLWTTPAAIARFVAEVGDSNPLWTNETYAESSPVRALTAPPSFLFACLSRTEVIWPGFEVVESSVEIDFHRPIRVRDLLVARTYLDEVGALGESPIPNDSFTAVVRHEYWNQHDEPIATLRRRSVHCRDATRSAYSKRDAWTPKPDQGDAVPRRGAAPRFWQDVDVGTVIHGPSRRFSAEDGRSDRDGMAVCRGWPATPFVAMSAAAHAASDSERLGVLRSPAYSVRFQTIYGSRVRTGQIVDLDVIGVGYQTQMLTDWMGDAGTLWSVRCVDRAGLKAGERIRLGACVTAKYVDADGNHSIRLTTWAQLDNGQNVMPGTAVIVLPSRC